MLFLTFCTWVKQTFEEADKNGDGLLNIEEIHQLMHKLNVNLPRRKVRQMFQVRFCSCVGLNVEHAGEFIGALRSFQKAILFCWKANITCFVLLYFTLMKRGILFH